MTETELETACDDTAMLIDAEGKVDKKTLLSLINDSVNKETEALKKQITSLQQKLQSQNPKNATGAQKKKNESSAEKKKNANQNNQKQKQKQQQKQKQKQKVKGTQDDNDKEKSKKNGEKQKQKQKNNT